jgi:hypothetical protein
MAQTDTSHGGKKERRLELFVGALLCHQTVQNAATAAKISLRTGWRYLQDPTVLSRLREASRESMCQAKMLVQVGSTEAVETLRRILHRAEAESAQVAASRVLLEMAMKTIELNELEERITRLETLANSRGKGPDEQQPTNEAIEATRKPNGTA